MPKAKKLPWVPAWLVNSRRARVGLSVLVEPGKEPNEEEWRNLWEARIWKLAENESIRDLDQPRVWEDLIGLQIRKVPQLLSMIDGLIAPGLWTSLWLAPDDQQAMNRLMEKFPQEDPAPSLEERLEELEEEGLNGLVDAVAGRNPITGRGV
jgi:hypothetical protein